MTSASAFELQVARLHRWIPRQLLTTLRHYAALMHRHGSEWFAGGSVNWAAACELLENDVVEFFEDAELLVDFAFIRYAGVSLFLYCSWD